MVKFAKGASSVTIKGRLKGDGDVDYQVRAGAGQTLVIAMTESNPQNYFNVLPPGTETAMFVGQDGGPAGYRIARLEKVAGPDESADQRKPLYKQQAERVSAQTAASAYIAAVLARTEITRRPTAVAADGAAQ